MTEISKEQLQNIVREQVKQMFDYDSELANRGKNKDTKVASKQRGGKKRLRKLKHK